MFSALTPVFSLKKKSSLEPLYGSSDGIHHLIEYYLWGDARQSCKTGK
jgi:hypothetical protein